MSDHDPDLPPCALFGGEPFPVHVWPPLALLAAVPSDVPAIALLGVKPCVPMAGVQFMILYVAVERGGTNHGRGR